jgi:hypothetical protein
MQVTTLGPYATALQSGRAGPKMVARNLINALFRVAQMRDLRRPGTKRLR